MRKKRKSNRKVSEVRSGEPRPGNIQKVILLVTPKDVRSHSDVIN
jgi:hypothetical protein